MIISRMIVMMIMMIIIMTLIIMIIGGDGYNARQPLCFYSSVFNCCFICFYLFYLQRYKDSPPALVVIQEREEDSSYMVAQLL